MRRTLFFAVTAFLICGMQISGQIIKDPRPATQYSEVQYTYDLAGNRISRIIVTSLPIEMNNDDDDELETRMGGYNEEDAEPNPSEGLSEREIHVYPNPVREELTIEIWKGAEEDIYNLLFYDSSGKQLITKKRQGNGTEPVDMSYLPKGIYFLIINTDKDKKEFKIVKE